MTLTSTTPEPTPMTAETFSDTFQQLAGAIGRVVVGQQDVVEEVLVALLARGHVLIEGVPGLGKTLLVRALSRALTARSSASSSPRI